MKPFKVIPTFDVSSSDKISCVCSHDNDLFVGMLNGNLSKYRLADSDDPSELVGSGVIISTCRPSKKKIEMLSFMQSQQIVLCLTDSYLILIQGSLASTGHTLCKNVSTFCLSTGEESSASEICVAQKKKLLLFQKNENEFIVKQEISISEIPLALLCQDKFICVGHRKGYSIIQLNKAENTHCEVFSLDVSSNLTTGVSLTSSSSSSPSSSSPCCTASSVSSSSSPASSFGASQSALSSIYSQASGKSNQVNNNRIIVDIGEDELMLVTQDSLGIFLNIKTQQPSHKNTIQWKRNVTHIAVCIPYILGGSSTGQIEVYSIRDQKICQTICIEGFSYLSEKGKHLLATTQSSVLLLSLIPYHTQMKKLLYELRISDVLELLNATFSPDDPRREIEVRNFHKMAGWVLFNDLSFPNAFQHFSYATINFYSLFKFWSKYLPPVWLENDFASSEEICSHDDIEQFIIKRIKEKESNPVDVAVHGKSDNEKSQHNVIALLELANSSMCTFLLKERHAALAPRLNSSAEKQPETTNSNAFFQIFDTLLLKLLVECEDCRWKTFINDSSHTPFCDVENCAVFFKSINRFDALALLYARFNRYDEALQIWTEILRGEQGSVLKDEIARNEILNDMSNVLCSCFDKESGIALLKTYSPIILSFNEKLVLRIFMSNSSSICPLLPDEIIEILSEARNSQELIAKYLEFLVLEQRLAEPRHKTRLALILLEKLLSHNLDCLKDFGANRKPPGKEQGKLGQIRRKLLWLFQNVNNFDVSKILEKVEGTCLTEEKVILYGKSNRHFDALNVLVKSMKDLSAAEAYCHEMNFFFQSYVDLISESDYVSIFELLQQNITPLYEKHCKVNAFLNPSIHPEEERSTFVDFNYSKEKQVSKKRNAKEPPAGLSSKFSFSSMDSQSIFCPDSIWKIKAKNWNYLSLSFFSPNSSDETKEKKKESIEGGSSFFAQEDNVTQENINENQHSLSISGRSSGMLFILVKVLLNYWAETSDEEQKSYAKNSAVYILNKYAAHPDLNPTYVIPVLPKSWPVCDVLDYFYSSLRKKTHFLKTASIQDHLGSLAYLNTYNELAELKGRSITITHEKSCTVCTRRVGDKAFAAHLNGLCVHLQCAKSLQKDDCADY